MEYNTSRTKLLLPEYGRNVQEMVNHLMTIEDPQKRLEQANVIVEVMAILQPGLKNVEDFKHKLWDHIYQMTDLQLEVDGPYPKPTIEKLTQKPEPMPYPQSKNKVKHFGKNLNELIEKAIAEPDEEKRQGYTQTIGYYMKLAYTNWHREPVHDDMIRNELSELTGGVLQYAPGGYKVYFDTRQNGGFNKNRNNRNFKNNGGNNNNRNFKNGGNFKNNNNKNNNNKYKNKNQGL